MYAWPHGTNANKSIDSIYIISCIHNYPGIHGNHGYICTHFNMVIIELMLSLAFMLLKVMMVLIIIIVFMVLKASLFMWVLMVIFSSIVFIVLRVFMVFKVCMVNFHP